MGGQVSKHKAPKNPAEATIKPPDFLPPPPPSGILFVY